MITMIKRLHFNYEIKITKIIRIRKITVQTTEAISETGFSFLKFIPTPHWRAIPSRANCLNSDFYDLYDCPDLFTLQKADYDFKN